MGELVCDSIGCLYIRELDLMKKSNKKPDFKVGFSAQDRSRTDTGLNPLVFETSASTNSATWA